MSSIIKVGKVQSSTGQDAIEIANSGAINGLKIADGGNIGSASDPDAISIASDGNISLGAGIVSGNLGTITQRSASSSSPTFSEDAGSTINKTNLYGSTTVNIGYGVSDTHHWFKWDYGAGVARKITKLQFVMQGQSNSTGVFLEGSNVESPNTASEHTDWTQLKALGAIVNDGVKSYSAPVTANTLKYRHYRLRLSWSSNNSANITKFVLEDTDSTFDARTALNATGTAPMYACRAWVNFDGTGTVAIKSSGNVSSITDNDTGNYTINFTTAMEDSNYSALAIMGYVAAAFTVRLGDGGSGTYSASAVQITCFNASAALANPAVVTVAVIR